MLSLKEVEEITLKRELPRVVTERPSEETSERGLSAINDSKTSDRLTQCRASYNLDQESTSYRKGFQEHDDPDGTPKCIHITKCCCNFVGDLRGGADGVHPSNENPDTSSRECPQPRVPTGRHIRSREDRPKCM